MPTDGDAFPGRGHDHGHCVRDAMARAESLCSLRGARLTALRRRVLEIVWSGHKPVGAYDILDVLKRERAGAQPPTVYRALDFLLAQGLIHRLESRNAYAGCIAPDTRHDSQFLICRSCATVAELDDPGIDAAVRGAAAGAGFSVEHRAVEIEGLCPDCRTGGDHA